MDKQKITEPAVKQKRRRNRRRNITKATQTTPAGTEKPVEPSVESDTVQIGLKRVGFYASLLRRLFTLDKYPEVTLSVQFPLSPSNLIWVANHMVEWGYCQIVRVKSTQDAFQIVLAKAPSFDKALQVYEETKASKASERDTNAKAKEQLIKSIAEAEPGLRRETSLDIAESVALDSVERALGL